MNRSRSTQIVLLCTLLVLLAGCTGLSFDDGVSEAELLEELEEAKLPEDMRAIVESHGTFENETISIDYEVWARQDGATRVEGELDGHRYVDVSDGEQTWTHNTSEDTVEVRESFQEESMIHDMREVTEQLIRSDNVSEIRETELEGRDVYHITFGPTGEDDDSGGSVVPSLVPDSGGIIADGASTGGDGDEGGGDDQVFGEPDIEISELWVDAEYLLLVKQVAGDDGFEIQYTDVEFDVGLEDDRFEFEVPPDATVEEVETPEFEEYDTLEEAQESVPFEFEEPDIESHSLDGVTVMTQDEEDIVQVTLEYRGEEEFPLLVDVRNEPSEFEMDGETVEIGDETTGHESATYEQLEGEFHRAFWESDDRYYSVLAGMDLDRDALLEVATEVLKSG